MNKYDFEIYTGLLRAWDGEDGRKRIKTTASSTITDLHGDTMTDHAVLQMAETAASNMTVMLNHKYEVPEDTFGSVEEAHVVQRGTDATGMPIWDLDFIVRVDESNPRAVQTWNSIQGGTKLGTSIGARIPPGGATKRKDGSYLIDSVNLMEASIVALPANPRSWVQYAVKAFEDGGISDNVLIIEPDVTDDAADVIDITEAAKCPDCGGSQGTRGCRNTFHDQPRKDVEPDLTDATRVSVTVETDDPAPSSQEAPTSTPENETVADETAPGDNAALGDSTTLAATPEFAATYGQILELLRSTTSELVELRRANAEAEASKVAALHERDEVKAAALAVVEETKRVIDQIAKTPLGRKSVFVEAANSFGERFGGIYSDDFLKRLKG